MLFMKSAQQQSWPVLSVQTFLYHPTMSFHLSWWIQTPPTFFSRPHLSIANPIYPSFLIGEHPAGPCFCEQFETVSRFHYNVLIIRSGLCLLLLRNDEGIIGMNYVSCDVDVAYG